MNIFLCVLAIIFMLGMIADNDPLNRDRFTYGFITVILSIVSLNIIKMLI